MYPAKETVYHTLLDPILYRRKKAALEWEGRAHRLKGMRLALNHKSFNYLASWLDLDIVLPLESSPGDPPCDAHLASLLEQLTSNPPVSVVRTPDKNQWARKKRSCLYMETVATFGYD